MLTTESSVVAVVIPCLNEEKNLLHTCQSLGFGLGDSKVLNNTFLILIDNGSEDKTLTIAEEIRRSSPVGSVLIEQEMERGYVPPRHRGNLVAQHLANERGWETNKIIVLQADADTEYSKGYCSEMLAAAQLGGDNFLLEGYTEYPQFFQNQYQNYIKLCAETDSSFDILLSNEKDDFIVDDKVCGYRLDNYFKWGGHQREYTNSGDEIHAESTRLYIRAFTTGCRRLRVATATGYHSTRKILANPINDFSTAGYPREETWKLNWETTYKGPNNLNEIILDIHNVNFAHAILVRQKHVLALFGLLPLHVGKTLGFAMSDVFKYLDNPFTQMLPKRTKHELIYPGRFIMDVLQLIDGSDEAILTIAETCLMQLHK